MLPFPPWKAALVAVLVVVCALAAASVLWTRSGQTPSVDLPDLPEAVLPRGPGFHERGLESGVAFRMNFMPGEQGEKFKTNLYDHGCGVAVGDFDGDGHDDVFFCNQLGRCALYRNKGDGTFEDITGRAGVGLGDRVCVGATFADYDNDGYQDLFVTSTRGGNVLFHNNGDGTFSDVTEKAKVVHVGHSQTAVFFDYDNDGFLDLFVTNTAQWTSGTKEPKGNYFPGGQDLMDLAQSPVEYNLLYRNNGDGTFTDVTAQSGLKGKGWGGDAAVFDFDEDGRLDLFVSNMFGRGQLYRNNGDGTFSDVAPASLGRTSWGAAGTKAFDFNNDGRLDLLIVDMHSDMWLAPSLDPRRYATDLNRKFTNILGPARDRDLQERAKEDLLVRLFQVRHEEVVFGNTLFKNLGGGKFEEVSDKAGMETWWPWGIAVGDFDNDGFEDVFLPSGMGFPFDYWPSALMMNNGNETFTDRARALGIDPPPGGPYMAETIGGRAAARSSRCAAAADFDGDGRLDLVVSNFNDRAFYFRNELPRKNYIAFRLTGTRSNYDSAGSNRDAIGALVTLHAGKEVMVRQVNPAGGYLSQSSRTVHFGLGERTKVDRVEIIWPRGRRQKIEDPEINKLHKLTEPPK